MDMIRGKAWKFGDDIDTDVIIPARYLNMTDPEELAKHVFEPVRGEDFDEKVNRGDVIVGGENFGCGSSREHAPIAIKASGASCVIAKSFARIFYRNSFNIGFPLIVQSEASEDIKEGDTLEINLRKGMISNKSNGKEYSFSSLEDMMLKLIEYRGLIPYILNEGYR